MTPVFPVPRTRCKWHLLSESRAENRTADDIQVYNKIVESFIVVDEQRMVIRWLRYWLLMMIPTS